MGKEGQGIKNSLLDRSSLRFVLDIQVEMSGRQQILESGAQKRGPS